MRVLLSLIVVAVVTSVVVAECRKPNENLEGCLDPEFAVDKCQGKKPETCAIASVYEINEFPAGTEEDTSKKTTNALSDCYRFKPCVWSTDGDECKAYETWTDYFQKQKTVLNGKCAA